MEILKEDSTAERSIGNSKSSQVIHPYELERANRHALLIMDSLQKNNLLVPDRGSGLHTFRGKEGQNGTYIDVYITPIRFETGEENMTIEASWTIRALSEMGDVDSLWCVGFNSDLNPLDDGRRGHSRATKVEKIDPKTGAVWDRNDYDEPDRREFSKAIVDVLEYLHLALSYDRLTFSEFERL